MEEITPVVFEEKKITLTMTMSEAAMLYAAVGGIGSKNYNETISDTNIFSEEVTARLSNTWEGEYDRVYESLGLILAKHNIVHEEWAEDRD